MKESGYNDEPLTKEQEESLRQARKNEKRREFVNKFVITTIVLIFIFACCALIAWYFNQIEQAIII